MISNSKLWQVLSLVLHDLAVVILVFSGVLWFRIHIFPMVFPAAPQFHQSYLFFDEYWMPLVWLGGFTLRGLYSSKYPIWEEVRNIVIGALLGGAMIFIIVSLGKFSDRVSRTVVVGTTLCLVPILPVTRYFYKRFLYWLGIWRQKLVIVAIADTSIAHLGPVDETEEILEREGIENVILDTQQPLMGARSEFLARLQQKAKRIMVAPKLLDLPTTSLNFQHFFGEDVVLVDFPNRLQNPIARFFKRAFDLAALIVSAPLWLPVIGLLSLAIWIGSGRPIFYRDGRVGKNNTAFECVKFRSMYVDADEILEEYLEDNPEKQQEWDEYRKIKGPDPRVTPVGRFLRKTSLDELPQLFNILKGDMSLVGPRPMQQEEIDQYGSVFEKYQNVRPGITGLWQVSGRNELTFSDRADLDNWYIKNWSPWLDFVILVKTVPAVFTGTGSY